MLYWKLEAMRNALSKTCARSHGGTSWNFNPNLAQIKRFQFSQSVHIMFCRRPSWFGYSNTAGSVTKNRNCAQRKVPKYYALFRKLLKRQRQSFRFHPVSCIERTTAAASSEGVKVCRLRAGHGYTPMWTHIGLVNIGIMSPMSSIGGKWMKDFNFVFISHISLMFDLWPEYFFFLRPFPHPLGSFSM